MIVFQVRCCKLQLIRKNYPVTIVKRNYSLPPRKTLIASETPIQLAWFNKVPVSTKYFSIILGIAFSITHIHPNTLITLGPPAVVGSLYLYNKFQKSLYTSEVKKVIPKTILELKRVDNTIRIKPYDETELSNVLNGIDDKFGHFKRQVVEIVERKVTDYVMQNSDAKNSNISQFIDNNNQIVFNINESEIETFLSSKILFPTFERDNEIEVHDVNLHSRFSNFIKFSLPYYSSKDLQSRKRLGVIQVYLLEVPSAMNEHNLTFIQYKMEIEVSPFKFFIRDSDRLLVGKVENHDMYISKILLETKNYSNQKNQSEEEEITIDL